VARGRERRRSDERERGGGASREREAAETREREAAERRERERGGGATREGREGLHLRVESGDVLRHEAQLVVHVVGGAEVVPRQDAVRVLRVSHLQEV
jgi:hypothetical protein